MSDPSLKEQPAAFSCPRCSATIGWQECPHCGGTGAWQFTASTHCGATQHGRFCSECGAALPSWREACTFCAGRGWLAMEHICPSADTTPPDSAFRADLATRRIAPRPAAEALVSAPGQPGEDHAAPEPDERKDRVNLGLALFFILIIVALLASPQLYETIRSSVMPLFGR